MTTESHLRDLITNYERIAGMLTGAIVELVTSDNDEQSETHARAVVELSEGVNLALNDLRTYLGDPKVLGRDNFWKFLLVDEET
jgi:hypothetical protein